MSNSWGVPVSTLMVPRGVGPKHMGFKNMVFVEVGEDVAAKYDWLKSSDRNGAMGALASDNWRVLVLAPGAHIITATWTLDTDFVAVVGLASPSCTYVKKTSGASALMVQTADTIYLGFFAIYNTESSYNGLQINATDNSDSCYFMFNALGSYTDAGSPIYGISDINGLWEFCETNQGGWRLADNKKLSATMRFCSAGYRGFGGDNANVEISGTLEHCYGGEQSFGGCGNVGCNITGNLYRCEAGSFSFAIGKTFSGKAVGCRGGKHCFAGYDGSTATYFGTFSGVAIDCETTGGNSFGMGHSSCVQSGVIKNCRNGRDSLNNNSYRDPGASTITDNGSRATVILDSAAANSNLTFTAREYGVGGNDISVKIEIPGKSSQYDTVLVTNELITIRIDIAGTTAATVKSLIEAAAAANTLVTVSVEGDGSGNVDEFSETNLAGGVNKPCFAGNAPAYPIDIFEDITLRPFLSGITITNAGASGTLTVSLPAAERGYEFHFEIAAAQQLRLDPDGTETIAIDGSQQGAGKYIVADAIGERCSLKCIVDGQWEQFGALGTWTAEA